VGVRLDKYACQKFPELNCLLSDAQTGRWPTARLPQRNYAYVSLANWLRTKSAYPQSQRLKRASIEGDATAIIVVPPASAPAN
jgi:hypothetical protein